MLQSATILSVFFFTLAAMTNCTHAQDNQTPQGSGKFDTASNSTPVRVDNLSSHSLLVYQLNRGHLIGTATGFPIRKGGDFYLITNWHVVSGRDPTTNNIENPQGLVPDTLRIVHHGKPLGRWITKDEPLVSEGKNRWLEHQSGSKVDVVALPLASIDDSVQIFPLDLALAQVDMIAEVAMAVVIVGFPAGLAGPGRFPIWKSGSIASEPGLDFGGEPVFLIDATTRGGMSGSPVYLKLWGGYRTETGKSIIGTARASVRFLGVYSAQQRQAELGKVWRPRVIDEIFHHAEKGGS